MHKKCHLLRISLTDAVLCPLVVEASRVPVLVALKVRHESANVHQRLLQKAWALQRGDQ